MASKNTTPVKPPSVLEIADTLRSKGIKQCSLWDLHPSKWDYKDVERWEAIKADRPFASGGRPPKNKRRVMRVSDGLIYETASEAIDATGISASSFQRMLNKGLIFKRL